MVRRVKIVHTFRWPLATQPAPARRAPNGARRDGKSFIFLKRLTGQQAVEPVVVLNWVEEVKRLMAAAGIK